MGNVYCPEDLPNHEQVNCDDYLPGGISEFIIFNSNATTTDPTSASQINTDLTTGRATHVKDIIGQMPEAEDKVINHPRDNREITQGFLWSITYIDWNFTTDNINFYDELNYFRATSLLWYEPLLDGVGRAKWVTDISNGVSFKAKPIVPESDAELQNYNVSAMWSSKFAPSVVDLPTGIFNQ